MFVLDSHCDTPSQIYRLRDMSKDNDHAQIDFPKLKRGRVDGAFFALYVPAALGHDEGFDYASVLLDATVRAVYENNSCAAFAKSISEAAINKARSLFSVFLGLENGAPIGNDLSKVKYFYDKGIRYITLCHSLDNQICDSCASSQKKWGGLSPFGREVVAEMNRLGMLVDVSHASDDTFYDVLKYSDAPVVATHSCCRAISDHPRNLSDEMIRALAAAGGVVQINFYPLFLDASFGTIISGSDVIDRGKSVENDFIADPSDPDRISAWNKIQDELMSLPRPSFKRIADHIDHVAGLVGIDHVGIGTDFDGIAVTPSGMENISMLPMLFEELGSRGYTETDLEKIASGNFFRVFGHHPGNR